MTEDTDGRTPLSAAACAATLAVLTTALVAVRLSGPLNLLDNEYRIGASVLDVLQNHNWLCPHDALGHTDKPPLLVWLSALAALPTGHVTPFTIYLPSSVAVFATSLLVLFAGRRYFDVRTGVFAALSYLLCDAGARQVATARWDALFAFTVCLTALAALRAWIDDGSWTPFWLAGALATLTKGPLGVALGAFGLLAVFWERLSGHPAPTRGSQRTGVILYLVIVLGWFGAAVAVEGRQLVDEMLVGELVGHAVEHAPFRRFFQPAGDFLAMAAPWSIFACLALVRVVSRWSMDQRTRRVERFLWCWFVGGLLLFSISPHNASRLLYPILPPAALLTGRELSERTMHVGRRTLRVAMAAVASVALGVSTVRYHHSLLKDPEVQRTTALRNVALLVRNRVGDGFPVAVVDAPYAFQLLLNTRRPAVSFRDAAALLRGEAAALVVVQDVGRLRAELGSDRDRVWTLAQGDVEGRPWVQLVGNRPTLAAHDVPPLDAAETRRVGAP